MGHSQHIQFIIMKDEFETKLGRLLTDKEKYFVYWMAKKTA